MKMFLAILLAAGAAVGFVQQRRIAQTRAALDDLLPAGAEARALHAAITNSPVIVLAPEQIGAMRAERSELMRLRAGISDLRIAAQTPDKIEAEIARLNAAAERDTAEAKMVEARIHGEHHAKGIQSMLQAIGSMLRVSAQHNGGKPPRTVEQFKQALAATKRFPNFDEVWAGLTKPIPPFNLSLDLFEFVPESASLSGAILLRERQPRQLPSGSWSRWYLTSDYKSKEITLKNLDFGSWENENL